MNWIPGPTEVRPALLAECARPMIGHRGAEMVALIERLDPHLKLAFGVQSDATVAVHTCSATGIMEAALHGAGRRVLALVNGAFSKRWHEIAVLLGKDAQALEVPWGSAVEPAAVAQRLRDDGPFDALMLIANETSTGVRTPIAPIAAVLRNHPQTLFLLDVVSLLGGAPVEFDANGADLAFAGTQKALALPPGLTVMCASRRYLERAKAEPRRSFYLDPVRIVDGHRTRKTPSTPAIGLYYALARQLEDITGTLGAAAWERRFEKHRRMQARTAAWAEERGLALLPEPRLASPTVSCIRADGLATAAFVQGLRERGHWISNGYGELKDKTFRIGHMGDHDEAELEQLFAAADAVLAKMGRA